MKFHLTEHVDKHEHEVKNSIFVSRDSVVQKKAFLDAFRYTSVPDFCDFSPEAELLWDHLVLLVKIMRANPGVTIKDLMWHTNLSARDIRSGLRLLVTLGAEIELVCKKWQAVKDGGYILHN